MVGYALAPPALLIDPHPSTPSAWAPPSPLKGGEGIIAQRTWRLCFSISLTEERRGPGDERAEGRGAGAARGGLAPLDRPGPLCRRCAGVGCGTRLRRALAACPCADWCDRRAAGERGAGRARGPDRRRFAPPRARHPASR